MADKRSEDRKKLTTFLQIFNRNNNQVIGYLADFSKTGMMIVSKTQLGSNVLFQLKLTLPKDTDPIEFDAKSVWCNNDPNIFTLYNVGFQFTNIDETDAEKIETWFEKLWLGEQ